MSLVNDYSALTGIWKSIWGDTVFDPFKFIAPIITRMPLEEPASSAGGVFYQPIMVTKEAGITHAPPRTTPGYGTQTFIGPNAGTVPSWAIEAPQIYGRSLITYESMMRSLQNINSSDANAKKAVKSATALVVNSLGRSLAFRAEVLALNGGLAEGLGTIEAAGTTPVSTTYQGTAGYYLDVSVSAATWARGIFAGLESTSFDIYNGTTKVNVTANGVLSGGGGPAQTGLVLVGVNPASPTAPVTSTGRVLRFFHTVSAALTTALVANYSIFFESGGPSVAGAIGSEPFGLSLIAGLGTGGTYPTTMYGIDSSQYSMARGNVNTATGAVNFAKLQDFASSLTDFGVMGQTITAYVPNKLFASLVANEAALRQYAVASKRAENGFNYLEFATSGNNLLEVVGHPFQKQGRLTMCVHDELHRVGPQDVSFLKRTAGQYALEVPSAAASEVRASGQYNIYSDTPRHMLTAEGITY